MSKKFDFTTTVDRAGKGNLKAYFTPQSFFEEGILSFNAAEMDFKTAPSVIEAMIKCAEEGLQGFTLEDSRYTDAVCWWMKTQRGTEICPEWIEPTHGMIFSLATCIRMASDEGDNIIIMPPVYNRYRQAADRLGRGTVKCPLEVNRDGSYSIDFHGLETVMSDPFNKILALCNPNNPTGSVWNKKDLDRIAKLAVKNDVIVFCDEIFADYTFDNHDVTPYFMANEGRNNGITGISLGKTFNFTGVNHANMIIPDPSLRERFKRQKYADHYGSLEPMHRAAHLGAYCSDGAAWKNAVKDLLEENYYKLKTFVENTFAGVKVSPLQGGYVMWIDWSGMGLSEEKLSEFFLTAKFIPEMGTDFETYEPCFTRINIATTSQVMNDAIIRLKTAKEQHSL